jgi:tetratricopeptide (TPR) repeat protein
MRTSEYLMEKYLDSTITVEEKDMLGHRLMANPSLQRELALRHEINQMVIQDEVHELRAKLNIASAYSDDNYENRFISHRTKRIFYAAATIAGIAVGSWALFSEHSNGTNYEHIYRESFAPYPPVTLFRQGNYLATSEDLLSPMKYYQESNFAKAAVGLELLLKNDPSSTTIKFYLAISYMELERFADSHKLFDEILKGDSFFVEQATWYKGLSYLAEGKTDLASNTLSRLAEYENPYTKESVSLIKRIKSN